MLAPVEVISKKKATRPHWLTPADGSTYFNPKCPNNRKKGIDIGKFKALYKY